jgi:hypothetical protein
MTIRCLRYQRPQIPLRLRLVWYPPVLCKSCRACYAPRCRHRRARCCACHRHAPPLLCARHYALIIVFWWLFPPSSCTPLCSLSLSALPAEGADSPRIPGLKIVEAHRSGQNAERFWKERKVRFRAQAAIDGRRTTKSWSREKIADFGGCAQEQKSATFCSAWEDVVQLGVYRKYGNFRQSLAVRHTQPQLPATRIIM